MDKCFLKAFGEIKSCGAVVARRSYKIRQTLMAYIWLCGCRGFEPHQDYVPLFALFFAASWGLFHVCCVANTCVACTHLTTYMAPMSNSVSSFFAKAREEQRLLKHSAPPIGNNRKFINHINPRGFFHLT